MLKTKIVVIDSQRSENTVPRTLTPSLINCVRKSENKKGKTETNYVMC